MKKILLATALSLAVTTTASLANQKNGFYIGAGVAQLVGHHDATATDGAGANLTTRTFGFSKATIGADLIVGYSAYINHFLLGVELDYMFGNINKTISVNPPAGQASTSAKAESTGGAWGGAVRLGYSCNDAFTPYIRLGFENRRFKLATTETNAAANTLISASGRKTAFAPGVGVDVRLNKNLLLGLEYRYAIYSSITKSAAAPVPGADTLKITPRVSTALVSLKYVF
jgi:opacity protein-like surface antigen